MSQSQEENGNQWAVGELVEVGKPDLFTALARGFEELGKGAETPHLFRPDPQTLEGWIGAKSLMDLAESQKEPTLVEVAHFPESSTLTLSRTRKADGSYAYRIIVSKAFQKIFEDKVPQQVVKAAELHNVSRLHAALASNPNIRLEVAKALLGEPGLAKLEDEELQAILGELREGKRKTTRL